MKKLFIISSVGLSILICGFANASSDHTGHWIGIAPNYKIDEKRSLSLQAEFRHLGSNSLGLVRPSYHYKLNSNLNFGLGGDWFIDEIDRRDEGRLWPEINFSFVSSKLRQGFNIRLRQEVRRLSGVSRTGWRTRLMVSNSFKISDDYGLSGQFFDEVFYSQMSFSGEESYLDRNWLGFRMRKSEKKFFYDLGVFWERAYQSPVKDQAIGILSLGANFS